MRATLAERELIDPSGDHVPVHVLTGQDGNMAMFSGPNAAERAYEYGRANYTHLDFRVMAKPGMLGVRGAELN